LIGLLNLAYLIGLDFEPEYIMQDSAEASYNAARTIFPNAIILMCFFHVMQNVNIV
jgi:hypothetical protein